MKTKRRIALTAGLIASFVMIPAAPSLAEGRWTSSITNALTGFSSRSWNDKNIDSVATKTSFASCTETWSTPKKVDSITVGLIDHRGVLLPAKTVATQTTKGCGSANFGVRKKSTYHFTIQKIAGYDSGVKLTAKTVTQTY